MLKDGRIGALNALISFIHGFKIEPSLIASFEIPHMIFIICGHSTLKNVLGICIKLLINLFLLGQVVGINWVETM
jgi:hypothetical protein